MRSRLSRRARATACSTALDSGAIPVIRGVLPDSLPFCHCGVLAGERQREGGIGVPKRVMRNWSVGASPYARLVQRQPSGRFISAGQRVEDAKLSRQAGEAMILKSSFPGFGMRIFHLRVQCFWQFKENMRL